MTGLSLRQIRVITKLPNSEQSNKGKVKTHKYINRQNQSTTDKLSNILIFARLQIINRFFRSRRMTKIIHQYITNPVFVCILFPNTCHIYIIIVLLLYMKQKMTEISVNLISSRVFCANFNLPPVFSGVRATRSLVLCVCFVDRCLSFCRFSFGHCAVCQSSFNGF